MPRDKQSIMNSPMAKAYTSAEDDINGVVLPAEGTSILIMASDIPVNYSFEDLIRRGYTVSDPFVVNQAEGQWGYNIGFPKKSPATSRSGSADKAEYRAIDKLLKDKGFDPKAFGELMKLEESKLEAGKKTNWKPGRLPSGGRIAENGVYIPADAMREDARKARMKK